MHQVNQQELDRAAYTLAKDFLLQSGADKGVTPELIEKYLHISAPRPDTLAALYERMLESAQSGNMNAGVIGGSIGGVGNLGPVLCDFEPAEVLEKYQSDWEEVLDDVVAQLKPRGSIRRTPRSIWPRYCRTILSSAKFLSQFESASDFYEWVDLFDRDERARAALLLLLDREIEGFGFALACDFVMGLGYENFSKPDVHIKDIFQRLGLCPWGTSDYEVFKAVARVARDIGVTPYNVDKLFWLIGSGYFYEDPHIGHKGRIGSLKKQFIEVAQIELEPTRDAVVPPAT
jgi:thermostable 8-oxoguanine DNA glycosylase